MRELDITSYNQFIVFVYVYLQYVISKGDILIGQHHFSWGWIEQMQHHLILYLTPIIWFS